VSTFTLIVTVVAGLLQRVSYRCQIASADDGRAMPIFSGQVRKLGLSRIDMTGYDIVPVIVAFEALIRLPGALRVSREAMGWQLAQETGGYR
jgi:hypothetical protein